MPLTDETSFSLQLQQLGDEELLDFWAQTQQIQGTLAREYPQMANGVQDYERLIVLELQLRSCSKSKTSRC